MSTWARWRDDEDNGKNNFQLVRMWKECSVHVCICMWVCVMKSESHLIALYPSREGESLDSHNCSESMIYGISIHLGYPPSTFQQNFTWNTSLKAGFSLAPGIHQCLVHCGDVWRHIVRFIDKVNFVLKGDHDGRFNQGFSQQKLMNSSAQHCTHSYTSLWASAMRV